MSPLVAGLFIITAKLAAANDATTLLQSNLHSDGESQNSSMGFGSNFTVAAAFKMYRINLYNTYGSDHSCVTEISFQDPFRKPLVARYAHQTSCYGCPISCDSCTADWGNPAAQFDQVTDVDTATSWSCTAPGTFPGGRGAQSIVFTLPSRPAKGIISSTVTDGAWAPKRFSMQEQQSDGTWRTIAMVAEAGQTTSVEFYIQMAGSMEDPAKWPIDEDYCGSNEKAQVYQDLRTHDVIPDIDPVKFSYSFTALSERMLTANSLYGFWNGMSIDGNFGSIVLPQGNYEVRQLVFNFPSNFRLDGDMAEGEVHIILQKQGSPGLFDSAVIVILLQLPDEDSTITAEEKVLIDMGLLNLPAKRSAKNVPNPIDLSVFKKQLDGYTSTLDCSPSGVPWFVLATPYTVSGSVVESFHNGPPAHPPKEVRTFEDVTGTYEDFVDAFGDVAAVANWEDAAPKEEEAACVSSAFGCCDGTTYPAEGPNQAGCDTAHIKYATSKLIELSSDAGSSA